MIDTGTVDVVGVDPGWARGITGFRATIAAVEEHRLAINAHAFTAPVVFAAALALSQSTVECGQLEYPPTMNTLYDLVGDVPEPVAGRVAPNDRPGSGSMSTRRRSNQCRLADLHSELWRTTRLG